MLTKAKKAWAELKRGKPGKRFQERYRRKSENGGSGKRKPLMIGLGLLVFVAGIFFLPAPGPGIVIVALGAGMLAGESLMMAKALDWAELKVRAVMAWALGVWKRSGALARVVIVLVGVALVGAAGYGAWMMTFGR